MLSLARPRAVFRGRDRLPRFEYVEGFAPGLAAARGARLVFLAPGSDDARSVYERIGFRPAETSLFYADPENRR